MEIFYGDPAGNSPWSAFIAKFETQASRSKWSDKRKLERLYDCLSGTALEFANKCVGKDQFEALKKELGQQFDLKDTPIAARQNLHRIFMSWV